ncbi:AMP-dependent synthetase/ligase [Rhodococcoides kyotonense]|uniref:Long-chain acyl-CoA synthetase n=1 Tax=Rhodococcoides kyotonense TaxID=398843 RepID=A0A239JYX1_9NOCA|nr:AMP-binding protein [Rhodococcus kyotonensis]SNT10668.1 long-chain acyl-CoA synthetase [Rhodococcus kyotonensis]
MPGTIHELLAPHMTLGNSAPAQRFATESGWTQRSYGELRTLVDSAADVLYAAGVRRGDRVAIQVRTRADWTVVDLAAASLGAALVPVYPTAAWAQLRDIVERTSPAVLVVERGASLPEFGDRGPHVLRLGDPDGDLGDLASQDELAAHDGPAAQTTDLFSISFSSGSTGKPKGCMLTHANYAAVVTMAIEAETHPVHGLGHRELAFVYLPLAHASARLQQLTTFAAGGELAYGSGGTADILRQIADVAPTYVPGVPRLFESAYMRADRDPLTLRNMFGNRLAYALTGGAPIASEMLETYARAGISLVEGYGLTETSTALTIATPHDNKPGTVGRPLSGVQIRTAEDGEILARGPNIFLGYLDDDEATADVLRGGWFHTGDLGSVDVGGYLTITGRKKNLIVTSTGKNVAPEHAENIFRRSCRIDGVVVVGDGRPFLIAVVFAGDYPIDDEELGDVAFRVNADVSPPEWIRKILVLDRALSHTDGELTDSGKIVRHIVLSTLDSAVDDVYRGLVPAGARVIDTVRQARPAAL